MYTGLHQSAITDWLIKLRQVNHPNKCMYMIVYPLFEDFEPKDRPIGKYNQIQLQNPSKSKTLPKFSSGCVPVTKNIGLFTHIDLSIQINLRTLLKYIQIIHN